MTPTASQFVMAIDQGTTSTRAIIFDHSGQCIASAQREHQQIFPQPGWVEHDPTEIITNVDLCIAQTLAQAQITPHQIAGIGITNQRETTVVWDKTTGKPLCNAIVWQDTRTDKIVRELAGSFGPSRFQDICGLPLATYFSGPKIRWILDNIPGAHDLAQAGQLLFGNTDTWVIWNLTGGINGGLHLTDVTNASRTMLMDLHTFSWRRDICDTMGVPLAMLPQIRPSSQVYGPCAMNTAAAGAPIAGDLGDQQAALFGQACFNPGMAKNTYGTGAFLLMNTGNTPIVSTHGLLTTVGYQIEGEPAQYALEGSVAVAGSLVQWLRDNIGIIESAGQIEHLAKQVPDNGGIYIVPAFSGLFAPYWDDRARGAIVGLTRFNNRFHLARAALEATAFQTREVLDAMCADLAATALDAPQSTDGLTDQVRLTQLRVDGGMIGNETLMQFQADILGVDVVSPQVAETTALGAAYAAGIAVGFWQGRNDVVTNWSQNRRWQPQMAQSQRDSAYRWWKKAVTRTQDWVEQ